MTTTIEEQITELRGQGRTILQICAAVKLSEKTVSKKLHEMGLTTKCKSGSKERPVLERLKPADYAAMRRAAVEDADRVAIGSYLTDRLISLGLLESIDDRTTRRVYRLTDLGKQALREANRR